MLGLGNILTKGGALLGFPNKYSFNFDGSNDYLELPITSALNITGAMTVSGWFKVSSQSSAQFIICKDDTSNRVFNVAVLESSSGNANKLIFNIYNGGSATSVLTAGTVTDNNWHHFAGVFVPSTSLTLYIDGTASTNTTSIPSSIDMSTDEGNTPIRIGNLENNSLYTNGLIDEIAIWDSALDAIAIGKISSKVVDLTKYSASNLKLWLRAGNKVLPEEDKSIARSDFYTDFDGVDQRVLASSTGLTLSDFSVSGWFYHIDNTAEFQAIIGMHDTGNDYSEGLVIQFYDDYLDAEGASVDGHLPKVSANTVGSGILQNSWNHFSYTVDRDGGSGGVKLYINGALATTDTAVDNATNANNIYIGAGYYSSTVQRFYKGYLSNIAIHQTVLDAQTIKQFAKSRYTPMRDNRFSAVDFDGTNDYIDLPMTFSYTNHSVIAWVYIEDDSTGKTIFEAMDSATDGIQIIAQSNESIRTRINTSSSDYSSTIYSNQWVHIVHTYDGSHRRLYINGERVINSATTQTIDTTTNARIGARSYTSPSSYFKGSMSSVSLYTAGKTEQEVYALYQKGITYNESSESDLFAYYKMGDDTSKAYPTVADSSSNSNDGTITNGASDDIAQQMVAGYDMGAFESSSEELQLLVTTGDWTLSGSWVYDSSTGYYTNTYTNGTDTPVGNILSSPATTVGKVYKLSYTVVSTTGSPTLKFPNNMLGLSSANIPYTVGETNVHYGVDGGSNENIGIRSSTGVGTIVLKDVKFEQVLQSELSDTYPAIIDVNEPVLGNNLATVTTFANQSAYGQVNIISSSVADGNGLYKISYTVDSYTSGNFQYQSNSGTQPTPALGYTRGTSTGDKVDYININNAGTHFQFRAFNLGYTGSISNIQIRKVFGNVGTMTQMDGVSNLVYSSVLPDQSFLTGVNSAYNFIDLDGGDQYISVQDDSSLTVSTALSVSTWINHDSTGSLQAYVTNWDYPNAGRSYRLYYTSGLKIELSAGGQSDTKNITASFTPVVGSWYHIAFTFDSGTVKAYINGESQTVTADAGMHTSLYSSNGVTLIGAVGNESTNTHHMNGKIGQTSIFNKVLSSTEVSAIYNLGRHGNLLDSYSDNLLGYWAMSALDAPTGLSDSISTVYDRSGNSNHGTPKNADAGDLKSPPNAEPNGYAKGDTNRSTTTP